MSFQLPKLPYAYEALEPYIDAKTMEIHHLKHHNTYITNLNIAVKEAGIENKSIEEICKNVSGYSTTIRNNAGGHYNHSFFWKILKPGESTNHPNGELAAAINKTFGSFEEFKIQFTNSALARFGAGWAWLYLLDGKLDICSTPNQDNPLMDLLPCTGTPILALDVWEHAYYLNYQNKRADYITAFWNIVNWDVAAQNFEEAKKNASELWKPI